MPNRQAPRIPLTPEERTPLLDARRNAKKASSAHAYVRGSTRRFYEWLASSHGLSLPVAPLIWIGGDCHVGNLGPVAASDGQIHIELRDLDQTVIGSPAHDIVRLTLSLAMAVRASALPGAVTGKVVEAVAAGYEEVLEAFALRRPPSLAEPPPQILALLREARSRSRRQLFAQSLGKVAAQIPIGRRFWPLLPEERAAVERLVSTVKVHDVLTGIGSRDGDDEVRLLDAAYWVKGCSSLGLWRAAAVVRVGRGKRAPVALLDIKEAGPPLAPRAKGAPVTAHFGERVVTGARALSPSLGDRMVAAKVLDRAVFVRELLPQDLKFELESLGENEAIASARHLASVVALAHARQLDAPGAAAWLASFRRGNAVNLDAPAWLWAATVDLVALHEGAYLEHCRVHALPRSPSPDAIGGGDEGIVSQHVTGD